jgi:uncharacterized protein
MIFVDTSAVIALYFPKDIFHSKADVWFADNKNESFVTTNQVVIEILNWARYKGGKKVAVEMGENLYSGEGITLLKSSSEDEKNAWKLFKRLSGNGVSMTDCISFVVMKRLKIKKAFAFDKDFRKAGFALLP